METILDMQPVIEIDDERFYALCQLNRDVRLERNQEGDVIIMPPTGGDTPWRPAAVFRSGAARVHSEVGLAAGAPCHSGGRIG